MLPEGISVILLSQGMALIKLCLKSFGCRCIGDHSVAASVSTWSGSFAGNPLLCSGEITLEIAVTLVFLALKVKSWPGLLQMYLIFNGVSQSKVVHYVFLQPLNVTIQKFKRDLLCFTQINVHGKGQKLIICVTRCCNNKK